MEIEFLANGGYNDRPELMLDKQEGATYAYFVNFIISMYDCVGWNMAHFGGRILKWIELFHNTFEVLWYFRLYTGTDEIDTVAD